MCEGCRLLKESRFRVYCTANDTSASSSWPIGRSTRTLCHLGGEALGERANDILELGLQVLAESTLLVNGGQQIWLARSQVGEEVSLPLEDLVDWDTVEMTVDTSVDQRNHLVDGHWGVLLLLEELGQL